jgi:hypothetical protein
MGDGRKAFQQSSKGGPRSCAPVQPRDLLNERNQRPRVDGLGTSIGQFGWRTDRRRFVPTTCGNEPASAEAKFSVVPSMVAPPVLDILETWTTPFYGVGRI